MLDAFVQEGIDMVALSFVRSAHDIRRLGVEPHPRGPLVIAKIETRAAVDNLDSIIEASGGVMIARGDLGAEMPIEELPHLQKRIIQRCITLGRPAITATQMLESMVTAPSPTRAEASDIANAVFDGSSALMLSGESAIGHDPTNAVATMARIEAIPSLTSAPRIAAPVSTVSANPSTWRRKKWPSAPSGLRIVASFS